MNAMRALLLVWLASGTSVLAAQQDALAGPPVVAPQPAAGQVGEDSSYIIGPGDIIHVFVWRNPELSLEVPVRSDGMVTTPLVEDLVAVGLTPTGLARAMEQRLAEYIRSPQVNIIVTTAHGAYSKVTVIGQVTTPQAVPYQQGMTLLDVVLAVGGLGEYSAGNRARIVRQDANGKQIEIRVKLADLVKKGRIKENVEMRPGDMLIVPESAF